MPSNVRFFFWLNCLSLLMGVFNAFLMETKLTGIAAAAGHGQGFVIGVQIFTIVLLLLLLCLTAFKRQNWARWVWLIMFILGAPGYIAIFKNLFGLSVSGAISLVQLALELVALYLIFTGNAPAWFRRDPELEAA